MNKVRDILRYLLRILFTSFLAGCAIYFFQLASIDIQFGNKIMCLIHGCLSGLSLTVAVINCKLLTD